MYEQAVAKDLVNHIDDGSRGSFVVDADQLILMDAGNHEQLMKDLQEAAKQFKQEIILETLWDPDYRRLEIRWYPRPD